MTYRVIAITGKAGVGKDYVADKIMKRIKEDFGETCLKIAFADQLKMDAISRFGFSFQDVYGPKSIKTRKFLQEYGTDQVRQEDEDRWVKYLWNWITLHHVRSGIRWFVITDCRFKNELQFLNDCGASIVKVESTRYRCLTRSDESISSHRSETEMDEMDPKLIHYVVHNEGENDLEEDVFNIVGNAC